MEMNMDRIAELRVLVAEATSGPWTVGVVEEDDVSWREVRGPADGDGWMTVVAGDVNDEANARLIAQAPTLATDLADALEREAKLKQIADAIADMQIDATAALQRMLREAAIDELRAIEAAWQDDPAMQSALIAIRNRRALKEQPE
jgi:hypothetical protein